MAYKVTEEEKEEKIPAQNTGKKRKPIRMLLEKLGYLKGDELLGLDLGHSAVKIVQIEAGENGWELVRADMEEIFPLSKTENKEDLATKAITAIQKIIRRQKIKVSRVVSGISGGFIKEKVIKTPRMKKNELKETLFWEAKKEVDWPPEKIVMDYSVNESRENPDENFVFLTIAHRDIIEEHLSVIEKIDLTPYALESKASALNACLKEVNSVQDDNVYALLDMGARSSFLVISSGGLIQFSREIKIAGDEITFAISNQIKCDLDFAERIKRRNLKAIEKVPEGNMVINAIHQQLDRLANEVNRSFGYFKAENPEKDITKLFLTGGTSKLEGVDKFFENQLKVKTKRFNPIEEIMVEEDSDNKEFLRDLAPHLTLAFGLATWRKK